MIDKNDIQRALRAYNCDTLPVADRGEAFYVCTSRFKGNCHNIWEDFDRVTKPNTEYFRSGMVIHFPIDCPQTWLDPKVQKSKFIIMTLGATTPFGYYSTLSRSRDLESSIEWIESVRNNLKPRHMYGLHDFYLGRELSKTKR